MYIRKGYKDMIKNLIFDVGGVLFDYRWKEMFMDYGLDEDNAIRVGTQMFNDPDRTWDIFDLGIKSDEEIADIFCKKYPGDEDVIRWFIRHGEYMQVPRPKVWIKVNELKQKGCRIILNHCLRSTRNMLILWMILTDLWSLI